MLGINLLRNLTETPIFENCREAIIKVRKDTIQSKLIETRGKLINIIDEHYLTNPMLPMFRKIQESKWNLGKLRKQLVGTSLCPVRVLDQSNVFWRPLRKYLIGSSDFHRFYNIAKSKRPIEVIAKQIVKDVSSIKVIKAGREKEPEVRQELEKEFMIDFAALWVNPEAFVVCATPDGVILDKTTRRPKMTLEIKFFNKKFDEKSLPSYLFIDQDGSYQLKENCEYMKQVQGQLFCTGLSKCLLAVKFECGELIRIKVRRNQKLIDYMVPRMVFIYLKYFLPIRLAGDKWPETEPLEDQEVEELRRRYFENLNFN